MQRNAELCNLCAYITTTAAGQLYERFWYSIAIGVREAFGNQYRREVVTISVATSKIGGMALRSGLRTFWAQHLCSLAKSADDVERIVGIWDVVAIAKGEVEGWLQRRKG